MKFNYLQLYVIDKVVSDLKVLLDDFGLERFDLRVEEDFFTLYGDMKEFLDSDYIEDLKERLKNEL